MRCLVLTLSLAAAAPAWAEETIAPTWAEEAGRPAFHAVQAAADGIYELASGGLLKPLLPESVASRLEQSPGGDSYDAFAARLRARQERAARRDLDSRPADDASPAAEAAWSRDALTAHRDAFLDAFAGTMGERYGLPGFGRWTGDYARDSEHWRPDFLAPAALLSGAYVYLAGLRADAPLGPVELGLDVAPGGRLRAAAQGNEAGRLARVAVTPRGSPLSLYCEWSARSSERVGASWSRRF